MVKRDDHDADQRDAGFLDVTAGARRGARLVLWLFVLGALGLAAWVLVMRTYPQ